MISLKKGAIGAPTTAIESAKYIMAMGKLEDQLLILLDLEKVLSVEEY